MHQLLTIDDWSEPSVRRHLKLTIDCQNVRERKTEFKKRKRRLTSRFDVIEYRFFDSRHRNGHVQAWIESSGGYHIANNNSQ